MTKPVTAVATMQLWESGKLELSDPVSWYIPAFREKLVDVHGELVPAKREICIQDLLNMTSGIPLSGLLERIPEENGSVLWRDRPPERH